MEHPLIPALDQYTPEELMTRVSDLTRKLAFAMKTGNADLCHQIRMAIESHYNKYQEKIRKNPDVDFDSVIDIS